LPNLVVATGGGVVLREDNRERLKTGRVVWLTADADTLWRRISGDASTADRRPALTSAGGKTEVELLLRTREPLYSGCADLTIDTTNLSPEAAARMILLSLATNH
jgi:shikimate kinase